LLVNTLSTIAFGAQPPPGSTPLAGLAAALAAAAPRAARALALALALAPGMLAPGEELAVRKGRLADEPAEADASAPGDGEAGAPPAAAPLAVAPAAGLAAAPLAGAPL
jgi:hypothetical protein